MEQATGWLEGRRLRAYELAQAGWAQRAIAAALGVSEGAVSKWLKRAGDGGQEALRRHLVFSRPCADLSAYAANFIPACLNNNFLRVEKSLGFGFSLLSLHSLPLLQLTGLLL